MTKQQTFATHCGTGATTLLNIYYDLKGNERLRLDEKAILEDMIELAARLNVATEALNSLGALYLSDQLEDMPGGTYEDE